MPISPRWLDIVRHRLRGFQAPYLLAVSSRRIFSPYLLIVQHHDIPATTLLAAPVTLPISRDVDVLSPRLVIGGTDYRARLLDISAVPRGLISAIVLSADTEASAISDAIDIILHDYPVGRPF
jgi:hypothetical protein